MTKRTDSHGDDVSKQVAEYDAWGLTKLAVRNIVVFFIVLLCGAVVFLTNENIDTQNELNKCEKDNTAKVEQLMREMLMLSRTQTEIEQKQAELQAEVQKSSKKKLKTK